MTLNSKVVTSQNQFGNNHIALIIKISDTPGAVEDESKMRGKNKPRKSKRK